MCLQPASKTISNEGKFMILIKYFIAITFFSVVSFVQAADGLIKVRSPHTTKATMDKFEEIVASKGLNIFARVRSEEHTSELQSRPHLVCRLLLEKKKTK